MAKRNIVLFIAYSAVICACLALMKDFGTAIIFFVAFLVIAFLRSGRTDVLALEFGVDGLIHGLRQVCNPDKLAYAL